jgi:hypothetical protein
MTLVELIEYAKENELNDNTELMVIDLDGGVFALTEDDLVPDRGGLCLMLEMENEL